MPAPDATDYPWYDADTFRHLTEGLARKTTTTRLAQDPNDPDIVGDLLRQERLEEVLVLLRNIVATYPERMPTAFEALEGGSSHFSSRVHGHPQALQEIVTRAKQQLPRLSREDAARVARRLLVVDRQSTCPGDNRMDNQLRCFLDEYAGTEAALFSQVDFIAFERRPLADRLITLDQLVRDHPRTVVAAKALSQQAFQLSSGNVYSGQSALERREADPTARLLRVLEIINELETGGYPPNEWIARTTKYVPGFFVDQARFTPENIDRLVEAYFRFVITHFQPDALYPGRYGIGGIIGSAIPRLLQRKGENNPDIEPLLDRLEREAPDRAAPRLLRAAIYIEWLRGERRVDRALTYARAVETLQALQAEGGGAVNRRALATLASLYFSEREYAHARDTFAEYLSRYPKTTWAWMAALRLGQSHEALGDWPAAVRAYSSAATTYEMVPFARVLGHAYAANMWQRLDQFDRALLEQRAALAGWDPDYGVTYGLYEYHPRRAEDDPAPEPDRGVARDRLTDETERLERSLRRAGGAIVERGRWLVLQGAFRDALAPLRRALTESRSSDVAEDAGYWERRGRVGIALQLAAADNPARNAAEALTELETVAHDRYDFSVFVADVAKACVLWQQGSTVEAETAMRGASEQWESSQRSARQQSQTDIGEDIAAIRGLVFHPEGNSALGAFSLNALRPSRNVPVFVIVNPEVSVRFANGTVVRLAVFQPLPSAAHVLFLTADQRAVLGTIVVLLDGRQNQRDTSPSASDLQPVDRRLPTVRAFWDRFFPAGDWQQTPGETGPSITDIEFLNTERTKAAARIRASSHGTTVMLQKISGAWRIVELLDGWIS